MVFSLIGAQPLTVVGITGLISLFNYTIFDIIKRYDVSLYPQFMTWVAIWTAIFHWIFAFLNFCDYMRYVTDFSSQSFGAYVGIIYCIKGVELLIGEFESYGPTKGFMDVVIALLFFFTVYMLELVGNSVLFVPSVRAFLGDYAYPVCIHCTVEYREANTLYIAGYNLLDWIRPFSRAIESHKRPKSPSHKGLLPHS